MLVSNSR